MNKPLLLTAAAAAGGVLVYENLALEVTRLTVTLPRLPAGFDGFRIAHIADLHNARFGESQARLLRAAMAEAPHIAVLTGDTIDKRRTEPDTIAPAVTLVRGLAEAMPVYWVTGNHECVSRATDSFRSEIAPYAVCLDETSVTLHRGDHQLTLCGMPDPDSFPGYLREWSPRLTTLYRSLPDNDCSLLLSHRPDLLPDYAARGFDLVLCGHAHGGQMRLPLIGGLFAPHQGILPRYTSGLYRLGGTTMEVSRGLGNSKFPLRFGNRPQVVILTLRRA